MASGKGYSGGSGGGGGTTDNTTDTRIPYKNVTEFDDSPLHYDSSVPKVVSDVLLEVPGGTIQIGDVTDISSSTGSLIVYDDIKEESKYVLTSTFDPLGRSEQPNYLDLGLAFSLPIQTDFSQPITTNPLSWTLTGTVVSPEVRQVNTMTLKTGGPMTNVTGVFIDVSTGLVLRYIPDKISWETSTGGISLTTGDNIFNFVSKDSDTPGVHNLGINPFIIENGQHISIQIKADAVNLLGDITTEPYQIADVQDGVYKDIGLDDHATRVQTTGLLEGGVLSLATSTTVDWTSGAGQVADYSDPENPVITDVTWGAVTGFTPTNLATDGSTIFGYNSSGVFTEKLATAVTIQDAHDYIFFSSITHIGSTIISINPTPGNLGYDGIGSYTDFINLVIGPANIDGNIYGENGANLNIDVLGGNAYIIGSNFRTNTKIPDSVTLASDTALDFQRVYQSTGLNMTYQGAVTDTINPNNYDDGSGTLASVTTDFWTIQRIYRGRTGETFVAYGQQEFTTRAVALEALGSEPFTEKSPLPFMLFRCSLLIKEGATDLSDTNEAEFFEQSSFRLVGAQSSSSAIPGVTSPGGVDTSVQFNNGGSFGGDSNLTYDTTLRTLCLKTVVSDTALIQFKDSLDAEKMIIQYDENADNVFLAAANGVDLVLSTGSGAFIGFDNQNPISTVHILEISSSVDETCGLTIENDGSGDAVTQYYLTGVQRWVTGIDNTDNSYKIASSTNVGTDVVLSLDPDGHADFSSSVSTLFGGFGSAQNLVKYSQELDNAEWTTSVNVSVVADNATAPDGTLTADTVTWTGSGELVQSGLNIVDTQSYIVSFWGRHVSGATDVGLELGGGTTIFQTLTSTLTRYSVTVTASSSSLDFEIQSLSSAVFELWGFQIADNIDVLSYTRTEADSIDVETTGLVSNGKFLATGPADFSGEISINDPIAPDTQELMTYITGGANGGTSKIYTGSRTPEGNVTADGGSLYIRDDGTSSDIYIKRSDSSNTGWFDLIHADSGVKGPASSIQYAIARFDDTTGSSIDGVGQARLVLTSSDTALVMGPQLITGNDEIIFTDITNAEVGSIVLDTDTGNLTTTVVGGDLIFNQQGATSDIDTFLGSDDLLSEYAIFNDSLERIFTVSGDKTVKVHDDVPISFGTGSDLSIVHDGTNSNITNITGDLIIESAGSTIFYEDTAETGEAAGIKISQDGTGDAMLQYQLIGGQRWATGIDNTDDKYKIASGNFNNMESLAIDTDYHVALANSLGTPFGGLGKIQNYLSYSEDFDNAVWQKLLTNPPTVVSNNAIAPDGSLTADTVTFPGPGSGLFRQGGLTTSTSTAYTITGWVKHVSGGSVLSIDIMDGTGGTITADNVWRRYIVNVTSGTTGSYLDIQRGNFGVYEFWGWQISDGNETTPYAKTLETSLDTLEYGSVANESMRLESREVATVGMEVVEVWTLADLPDPVSDVITIPGNKFYQFMKEFSFGINQVQFENFEFVIFSQADAFMTSITYDGTLPWFIGEGHLRLAGNGCTIKMTADNSTLFDLNGGFGTDFSSVVATGANASMGEIRGQATNLTNIISARFFSDLSVFSGFKTGIVLDSIQFLNLTNTNTFLADDAVGPEFTLIGNYDFISFDSVEIQAPNAGSSFLKLDPTITTSAIITKCLLNGDGDFFEPGTTGGISVFADASISATAITSVTDSSGTARFNFTGPTVFVGQKVVMSALTNYTNDTFSITTTDGTSYFETGVDYNGADTGSFLSDSVTVVTGSTPPAELATLLITGTLAYNLGSVIYNRTGSTFQINAVWATAETTGTWDTGSLTETSKYVTTSANGSQRDSKQLASIFVSGNLDLTSITGVGTYDPLDLGVASGGQGMEGFTLIDPISGELLYEGVTDFQGTVVVSISTIKTGGAVSYRFRLFKTVGSGAFDAVTVTRGITTTVGTLPLVTSITLNPGDQFRVEVESQGATNDITITDFSMVVE